VFASKRILEKRAWFRTRRSSDFVLQIFEKMVGAKGFEPSTSWSRTKDLNPINALSGVAYGTRTVISPLLVVRNLSVDLSVILRAR
jgi:hypothetical protein